MPPKCDGVEISQRLVLPHLTLVQRTLFLSKHVEYTTINRLYCSLQTCSQFLGSSSALKSSITCGKCGNATCRACKAPWHGTFGVCGAGSDGEVVEAMKKDFDYQQCPSCRRMVELETGCYHMTCRCGGQFCYLCATPWKQCDCVQWNEDRLVSAAQDRVAAQAEMDRERHRAPAIVPAATRVQQAMEQLRVNHQCAHTDWRLRYGGGTCESCFNNLGGYLLRCSGCMMLACVRCQRNRL